MIHQSYELTFRRTAATGEPGAPDVVVVERQEGTGPGGYPLYRDSSGILCAEISDRGEVRMLATGAHQRLLRPVAVRWR
ncbi:DUF6296 family protein [Kitasatospora sp. NPDC002227]|uniref:DUF6296 family protein n=1 Tax=Kitasatospora sp. NPDC002227 TaxID=3154773 RepID=UPI003317D906